MIGTDGQEVWANNLRMDRPGVAGKPLDALFRANFGSESRCRTKQRGINEPRIILLVKVRLGRTQGDIIRRRDQEQAYEERDADEDDEEMEEFEEEPKHVAADKRRKDAEKAKADSAEIRKAIKRVEAMIPKQLSDADYAAMADAQAKADTVYMAFGDSAPRPLNGEDLLAYRRRLAKGLQKHSPKVKEINLSSIQDPTAFGVLEDMVYSDAMAAALAPADLPQGQLREIKSRDTTGRVISQFVGQPRSWMGGHTGNRR